jgi:hypothetical protein
MAGRPPAAGPRTVRELFHYVHKWLNSLYDEIQAGGGGGHNPVTVTDSSTIDLTISGTQALSAGVVANSIGFAHIDQAVEDAIAAGGLPEAPNDGFQYARQSLMWTRSNRNVDGGKPSDVYTPLQRVDGGAP